MSTLMLTNALAYNVGLILTALGMTVGMHLMTIALNIALAYLLSHYSRGLSS